ncbi:MAG: electron transport complex subunit RsxC [Oscillospiraceae bacterium]|nr:electron transport complex subunit RsxC [Oscillospiraceae bacterium]
MAPVRLPPPETVVIPMSMHIGAPAVPAVKVGDTVKVGQLIAEAGGFVSSPVYASVSGKVKKIDEIPASNGRKMKAVVIASDGLMEPWEGIARPEVKDFESFVAAVRSSGVVGLGGAGFPTAVKLGVKDLSKVEAFIINGAECEPYVTSDTRTMLDRLDDLKDGVALLEKYMEAKRIIFGVEANKPRCIEALRSAFSSDSRVEINALPPMYPQGGEKVLIYNTTGRIVPEGKLPLDAGAIVLNVTTLASIARYINTGMPLVEKVVTVDGSAVAEPKNVIAPIGTPARALFEFCGGFKEEPCKVLYGGPMMGIAMPDADLPIMKNTNAVLALNEADSRLPKPTACIRCGTCVDVCPLGLMPTLIEDAYERGDGQRLKELKVNLCMECGSCAYACPAKRPLVQVHKLAKGILNVYNAKLKAEAEKKAAKEAAK